MDVLQCSVDHKPKIHVCNVLGLMLVWYSRSKNSVCCYPNKEFDIYIYINCKLLCRMKILKSMKTKVFLFFAFALRVSPLLRLFRHSKVCLLTYYVTDVILITIIYIYICYLSPGRSILGKNARGLDYGPRPQAKGYILDQEHSFSQYAAT